MAAGTKTDFEIFEEQFFGGMTETLQQNADAFNEASRGALAVITRLHRGDYIEESIIKGLAGTLVSRRDITSVSSAADIPLEQVLDRGVKLNRKIGPVAQALDAWKKIGSDPEMMSFVVGEQAGPEIAVEMLNTLVSIMVTSIGGVAALVNDYSATGTATHLQLVKTLAKFGDAAGKVVAWVMHSKPYYDLVGQAITDNVWNVGGLAIMEGSTATLGRPVVITDSSSLLVSGTPDVYLTLGLVEGAGVAMESEERELVSETVTGLENLVGRIQGEYVYTANSKGFQWDATSGGINPTAGALATASNWDQWALDNKQLPGVLLKTQ